MSDLIRCARDVVPRDSAALVVFSRWENLELQPDGTGWTGFWRIDPTKEFDKVILYLRDEAGVNSVYLADRVSTREAAECGRYTIDIVNAKLVATTVSNWREFAEGGSNPVRYLKP
jgi:hypothetical protein